MATDHLDRERIRFVDVNGIRTRYYEEGSGTPLVLVHGGDYGYLAGLGNWSRNLAALASRFHVYALDKLGQGFTDNPRRPEDYTFESLYDHFAGFLRAVGITGGHFVGHSRGAFLVTWLALEHPELVRTLVIVDSNTTAPEDPNVPGHSFYEALDRRTAGMPLTRELLKVRLACNSWGNEHVTDELLDGLLEIYQLPKTAEAQQVAKSIYHTVWLASLNRRRQEALQRIDNGELRVPTLLVWGADDPSAGLHLGHQLFARICRQTAQASLHIFNRAGHPVYREQADAFNRLLLTYCEG